MNQSVFGVLARINHIIWISPGTLFRPVLAARTFTGVSQEIVHDVFQNRDSEKHRVQFPEKPQ